MLEVGKTYKVKSNHKFHPNRMGIFQFLAGPTRNVVVLQDPDDERVLFCIGIREIQR